MDSPRPETDLEAQPGQLLARALRLHLDAIAARLGQPLAQLADTAGRRVVARPSCAILQRHGLTHHAIPRDSLALIEAPSPENGWRSRAEAQAGSTAGLTIGLTSVFVPADPPPASDLVPAAMPFGGPRANSTRPGTRVDVLAQLGRVDRRIAGRDVDAPVRMREPAAALLDECGEIDLGRLAVLFDAAEAQAAPDPRHRARLRQRRLHCFAGVAPDDRLEVVSAVENGWPGRFRTRLVRSYLRRRSDRVVLAFCESRYALPPA